MLTPNLTHVAFVLAKQQALAVSQFITTQYRPPQLSHCDVGLLSAEASEVTDNEWLEVRATLTERLGSVWCEKEDDVVRWRADRVWRRSVGLLDEAETCASPTRAA